MSMMELSNIIEAHTHLPASGENSTSLVGTPSPPPVRAVTVNLYSTYAKTTTGSPIIDVIVVVPLVTIIDESVSKATVYSYIDITPFGSSGSAHDRSAVMSYVPVVSLNVATVGSLNLTVRLRTSPGPDQCKCGV